MPSFSVICVYNNPEVLEGWLSASLESEPRVQYESIFIDNREGNYSSAAAALNAGAKRANGDYYIFVHQDVRFLGDSWLDSALQYLDSLDDLGIAGVVGETTSGERHKDRCRNIIYQGEEPEELGVKPVPNVPDPREKYELSDKDVIRGEQLDEILSHPDVVRPLAGGNEIEQPVQVQTLDELLVIIPRDIFADHQFDATCCQGWHLYAVEYCLRIKYQTEYEPYVLPLPVWHRSTGMDLDDSYYKTFHRMVAKHHEVMNGDHVYATTKEWPADPRSTFRRQYRIYRWIAKVYYRTFIEDNNGT